MDLKSFPIGTDLKAFFSTDEEMNELEDGDATTNIVGFVAFVMAPAPSNNAKNEILFKFRISNGSKRIYVLIWDIALMDKFQTDISCNKVININGDHCRATSRTRFNEKNNIVPFEIIIKQNTLIYFMGYYSPQSAPSNELQTVTFDDIHTKEGLIEIKGFIRTPFALMYNRSGLTTYGIGAITDGTKKITIQVKQFFTSTLQLGDYVTVKGTVEGEGSLVIIYCNSMDDVKLDPETDAMPLEKIQRGGRPVKRNHK